MEGELRAFSFPIAKDADQIFKLFGHIGRAGSGDTGAQIIDNFHTTTGIDALELEVELKLLSPCKRRIIIPDNLNLYQFHRILQGIFEWHDRHLHQFVLERDALERLIKVIQAADTEDFCDVETIDSPKLTVRDVFIIDSD